jgi:hypothetical protein
VSLLYRAIWQERRADLCDVAVDAFASWLRSKGIDLELPQEGHVEGRANGDTVELVARRALVSGVEAAQLELAEDRPGTGERWTTRLTAIDGTDGDDRWLWVDLERVVDDSTRGHQLAAPRLVRDLIEQGVDARVDQVRISTTAQPLAPVGLAGLIRNQQRSLPLAVFSSDGPNGYAAALRRASTTAERLAGVVQVFVLRAEHTDEFAELIGRELAVWGGAARVYLPNRGPAGLRPERHRYLPPHRMGEDPQRPSRMIAAMIAEAVTARRPPASYEQVRRELRLGRDRNAEVLLSVAESEIDRLVTARDELKAELAALAQDLLDTQADLDESVREASGLRNTLQVMVAHREHGERSGEVDAVASLAIDVSDMSEALFMARELLDGVVVPDGVERDLEDLDSHVNATSWGELTWRGLRALHTYARADWDGGFWSWCEGSGHLWGWPATDKKLAMTESETVQQTKRLREQRRFPVDTRVDPSGSVIMWSHLKIAEGGGPLAPRIYFHDDTRGETGKVHIGFVGPHRHTENTRTN